MSASNDRTSNDNTCNDNTGNGDDRSVNLAGACAGGVNHVAIVTADLERVVRFYGEVFGCERVDVPAPPGAARAAIVRLGPRAAISFVEAAGNPDAAGSASELARGHLDHVALDAPSPGALERARRRLVERGASDGQVRDYGPMVCVSFTDPDGMGSEVCWLRDPSLTGLHPPVPVEGRLAEPAKIAG